MGNVFRRLVRLGGPRSRLCLLENVKRLLAGGSVGGGVVMLALTPGSPALTSAALLTPGIT